MGFFNSKEKILQAENSQLKAQIQQLQIQCQKLNQDNVELQQKLDSLEYNDYVSAQNVLAELNKRIKANEDRVEELQYEKSDLLIEIEEAQEKLDKIKIRIDNKSKTTSELLRSIEYAVSRGEFTEEIADYSELLMPSVTLKLNCLDVKELNKAFKENDKSINKLLELYKDRYSQKSNKTIYELMVIGLRSELQNILYNLKYEKLDKAVDQVKDITQKYYSIAAKGNQNIASTLSKFISQLEYLFINAVKIEYNYYIKREQARQEQLAIREKMRQEAEERKALERERKKIEREESKYITEIEKVKEQLSNASDSEIEALNKKILELESKLSDVVVQKDKIVNLQNGKAGNVYIISNLGSFGDKVFKIGMTRRLDPQERINELGSASVPFKFDVHSFIFSEDAVSLENKLHTILNDKRVNKVNLRKEFFKVSIDELEALVYEIEPTAAFNKTMIAEEFRFSESQFKQ